MIAPLKALEPCSLVQVMTMPPQFEIAQESWEAHRAIITDLYMNKEWTLKQISLSMRSQGFRASNQQYVRQFKKWRLSKNATEEEWTYISRVLHHRSLLGKTSVVYRHGRALSSGKIRKETRRHHRPSLLRRGLASESMEHVTIRTPNPDTDLAQDLSKSIANLQRKSAPFDEDSSGSRSPLLLAERLPSMVFMNLLDEACEYSR